MAMRDETRMLLESMTRLFEDKATKQVVDARRKGHASRPICGKRSARPVCRWPRCRNRPAVPMRNGPTCTACCASPAVMQRRFRWRKRCWPAGSPPRPDWN